MLFFVVVPVDQSFVTFDDFEGTGSFFIEVYSEGPGTHGHDKFYDSLSNVHIWCQNSVACF
jgi:hypothetical protein